MRREGLKNAAIKFRGAKQMQWFRDRHSDAVTGCYTIGADGSVRGMVAPSEEEAISSAQLAPGPGDDTTPPNGDPESVFRR